jgi:hypothetical protein
MGTTAKLTSNSGTAVTLFFKQIDVTDESENEIIPLPNAVHYFVFLGNKGATLECSGTINNATDYASMRAWNAQNYVTISSSTVSELVDNETYAIIKRVLTRKGGYLNRWDFKLTLMRIYSGSTTLANGSAL